MLSLLQKYKKEVVPKMMEKFGYRNNMAVPKIEKALVNCGFGRTIISKTGDEREKFLKHIMHDLSLITGQKPVLRGAKKSIAGFKLRKGAIVGAMVTLRKKRMYDFLERLIYVVLPRLRDFAGIKQEAIDKKGSLSLGLREQIVFPEITAEKERSIFGLEVTVATTAKSKKEGIELLTLLGFPLKR